MSEKDYDKLREIIAQILSVERTEIINNYDLIAAGLTSITFVELIITIESAFSFHFNDKDLDIFKLKTVDKLIEYIDINR